MDRTEITLELAASRPEVSRALDAVGAFAEGLGLAEELAYDLRLAADEVLANIILHGYREDGCGSIRFSARAEGGALTLEFEDSAPPFDPVETPAPERGARAEGERAGGMGLILLRAVVPEISYAREGGRNRLTLRWSLPPAP